MKKQIKFENKVQVALFECEIKGQLSDGAWENTQPFDHWKIWCKAEAVVAKQNETTIEQLGPNFYPMKNNYQLTTLVGVIGDRMVNICNMAENNTALKIINDFNDYVVPESFDLRVTLEDINAGRVLEELLESKYSYKKYKEWEQIFSIKEFFEEVKTGSYDEKKLRKELKRMSEIMKMSFNETKVDIGICEHCNKNKAIKRINPYIEDIDGIIKYEYICDSCYENLKGDI